MTKKQNDLIPLADLCKDDIKEIEEETQVDKALRNLGRQYEARQLYGFTECN